MAITPEWQSALDQYTSNMDQAWQRVLDATDHWNQVQRRIADLKNRLVATEQARPLVTDAKGTVTESRLSDDQLLANSTEYAQLSKELDSANKDYSTARESYDAARANTASARQRLATEAKTPEEQAALAASTRRESAQTAYLQAQTRVLEATTDAERASAQANADRARALATQAQAEAARAPEAAQANVDKLVQDARLAKSKADEAERKYNSVTDAQLKEQARLELDAARTALDTARQQLENLKATGKLNDAQGRQIDQAIVESQARVGKSQEEIRQEQLGSVYGLEEKLSYIKGLIASGQITAQAGDDMLNAAMQGTDIYTAAKDEAKSAQDRFQTQVTQRGQDVTALGQRQQTFANMANQGMSQFGNLNQYLQPGSDAGGRALLAWLDMARQQLGGEQAFQTPAQVQAPEQPALLQRYQNNPSGGVTINIGSPTPQASPETVRGQGQNEQAQRSAMEGSLQAYGGPQQNAQQQTPAVVANMQQPKTVAEAQDNVRKVFGRATSAASAY